MKGSPILSATLAILLMAAAYFLLKTSLSSQLPVVSSPVNSENNTKNENLITCYIEAQFSSPPLKFTISDPISGKTITSEINLTDTEWTDEISLIKSSSANLNIIATWEPNTNQDNIHQNFIQLVLSPDQMDDSSVTLRGMGAIDTTATFQLK